MTLAAIHLLRRAGGDGRAGELIRSAVNDRTMSVESWRELSALLREHRAIDYAYGKAVEYAAAAKHCLTAFPPSAERDALLALPDYVLARDR